MTVRVRCSECETPLAFPDAARGKKSRCSECGHVFRLPKRKASGVAHSKRLARPRRPRRTRTAEPRARVESRPPTRTKKNKKGSILHREIGFGGDLMRGTLMLVLGCVCVGMLALGPFAVGHPKFVKGAGLAVFLLGGGLASIARGLAR